MYIHVPGVSPNTKIQIWKQITTFSIEFSRNWSVYHPIQKYKFESKSQLVRHITTQSDRCITQYKNTNLKANHNGLSCLLILVTGVSPNTKIQIWKQITTMMLLSIKKAKVYHPIQKYKFESKSQHFIKMFSFMLRCITQYKNTNLKANHNGFSHHESKETGVSPNTKIQIWKQITTPIATQNNLY